MKYDPTLGASAKEGISETKADLLASDCILNYRTVQSFGSDDIMINEFSEALNDAKASFISTAAKAGFWFGFS